MQVSRRGQCTGVLRQTAWGDKEGGILGRGQTEGPPDPVLKAALAGKAKEPGDDRALEITSESEVTTENKGVWISAKHIRPVAPTIRPGRTSRYDLQDHYENRPTIVKKTEAVFQALPALPPWGCCGVDSCG
jgi:hypothetical protein